MPLQLAKDPAYGAEDFVETPSNRLPYDYLKLWPKWETLGAIIVGPTHSGKTHLSHIWKAQSGADFLTEDSLKSLGETLDIAPGQAFILEDMEKYLPAYETTLFHLFNGLKAQGGFLLLTATQPPKQWSVGLKDLSSRLSTLPVFTIETPDDMLFLSILTKNFSQHQMQVDPKVIDFLMKTVARTFENSYEIPQKLSAASLMQRHAVTIPFVKKVLEL